MVVAPEHTNPRRVGRWSAQQSSEGGPASVGRPVVPWRRPAGRLVIGPLPDSGHVLLEDVLGVVLVGVVEHGGVHRGHEGAELQRVVELRVIVLHRVVDATRVERRVDHVFRRRQRRRRHDRRVILLQCEKDIKLQVFPFSSSNEG